MSQQYTTAAAQAARQKTKDGALALLREGKRELAMQRYVAILADDPADADALYYVAVIAIQEGQLAEAVKLVERAFQVGPPSARLHNLQGQAYLRMKRSDDALLAFERAIVCEPDFADAHGNRGSMLADMGRPEDALEAFDQALALRPGNPEDILNRATVLAQLRRLPEALAGCERALAAQPDFPAALRMRAELLRRLGPA